MKKILVVLDGAAGSIKEKKTAYSLAKKPNLDRLSKNGETGFLRIAKDKAPTSETGVISILGQDPFKISFGRGVFEALGLGVKWQKGWLALRANFATVRGKKIIDRRASNLSEKEFMGLCKEINQKVNLPYRFVFKPIRKYRALLMFREKLSADICGNDPAYQKFKGITIANEKFPMKIRKIKPTKKTKEARKTAKLLNIFLEKSSEVLRNSKINKKREDRGENPVNYVLLRAAQNNLPKLPKRRNWIAVMEFPVELGIAKAFGMKPLRINNVKNRKKLYKKLAEVANKRKENVYIHIKEPDVFAHQKKVREKAKVIEDFDKYFLGNLKFDPRKERLVVTSDHATPTTMGRHTNDPVPYLLCGKGIQKEGKVFTETRVTRRTIPACKLFKKLIS